MRRFQQPTYRYHMPLRPVIGDKPCIFHIIISLPATEKCLLLPLVPSFAIINLSNYITFYFSNMPFYSTEDENLFLALCYDIRHAFQGDRNTLSVENNSESIAKFASELYGLREMIDGWFEDDWFRHLDFQHTRLDAMQDRAMIEVLLCQFWKALSDAIGKKTQRQSCH